MRQDNNKQEVPEMNRGKGWEIGRAHILRFASVISYHAAMIKCYDQGNLRRKESTSAYSFRGMKVPRRRMEWQQLAGVRTQELSSSPNTQSPVSQLHVMRRLCRCIPRDGTHSPQQSLPTVCHQPRTKCANP